jgi:hypothetical protein
LPVGYTGLVAILYNQSSVLSRKGYNNAGLLTVQSVGKVKLHNRAIKSDKQQYKNFLNQQDIGWNQAVWGRISRQ